MIPINRELKSFLDKLRDWALHVSIEESIYLSELGDKIVQEKGLLLTGSPISVMLEISKLGREAPREIKNYEDHQRNQRFKAANEVLRIYRTIVRTNRKEYFKSLSDIFMLGYYWGKREDLEPDQAIVDLMEDYFHRKKSGKIVMEKRYHTRNELYEMALAFAGNSWEEGEELLHHKMVQAILKMPDFEVLSKKRLLRDIKPIAVKYDRFWNPSKPKE